MEHGKVLCAVDQIPKAARVALFGAGDVGARFAAFLQERRSDVVIDHFIDARVTGPIGGVRVVSPEAHFEGNAPVDLVIVTMLGADRVEPQLRARGFERYLKLNQHLVPASGQLYTDGGTALAANLARVRALLAEPSDRALYDLLTSCRSAGHDAFARFFAGFAFQGRQYLDFLRPDAIKTVVEGGIWDGQSTARFLATWGESTRIIGFEPFIENFLESPRAPALLANPNVRIEPFGLWKHEDTLPLELRLDGSSAIARGSAAPETKVKSIDVVALDDYLPAQGIESIDLLKLDVEAAEPEVLLGATRTLRRCRPQLAISIYHQKQQMYEIPLFLARLLDDYVFRLGHYNPKTPFEETVLYGIPRELM
ncbi:MAG TPA: FkbM family methyltransferase [Polyangia bacterium]